MPAVPSTSPSHLAAALKLHRRLPVAAPYFEYYGYDSLFKERGGAQCDLEKLDAAHVRAFGIALANGSAGYFQVGPDEFLPAGDADWAFERLLRNWDAAITNIRRCPRVRIVQTAADLPLNGNPGPIGAGRQSEIRNQKSEIGDQQIAVIPLLTSHTWMRDLKAVDALFARGLRISHAAGIICKRWCRSIPRTFVHGNEGPVFNDFGREVVARMNELGIVLDMSHMSDESTEAILEASSKPVVDGHTGSRTVIPCNRGHRDATLRKIADKGGVVGIHFADHLFTPKVWGPKYPMEEGKGPQPLWEWNRHLLKTVVDPEERMRLRKNRAEQEKFFEARNLTTPPPPSEERLATVADMADHVEHLVKVMGIEHVGLGGDVNGITAHSWPFGCDHVGELPCLTAEFLRRGWKEADLEKFLSANWFRVWRDCLPS
jgi:microsomal dipeptidase-like Zn-dependent dipeptidase